MKNEEHRISNVEASEIDDCWIRKSIIEQRIRNRE